MTAEDESEIEEIHVGYNRSIGFADIFMFQLSKVVNMFNVEFRGGFYTIKTGKNGEDHLVYVQDTREVFCNGVTALALLLLAKASPNFKEKYFIIMEKLERIEQEFIKTTTVTEKVILGESYYKEEGDKILLDVYKNSKLELFKRLFFEINIELSVKNYFQVTGGTF